MGGNRKPKQCYFVIVFEGRTGSSYTVSCLNSHSRILCYSEVLAQRPGILQKKILKGLTDGAAIEKRFSMRLNPTYYHGEIQTTDSLDAVGFKTKLQDLKDIVGFDAYLHQHDFRLVYLKRRNVIKSAISMLNAKRLVQKYGDGHWNASQKKQVQGAIYVDPDALLAQIKRRIQLEAYHQRFYGLYGGKKQVFYYEDLLQNEQVFLQELVGFLDAPPESLAGGFLKNTPDLLSDAILNYEEIQSLFRNSHFDRFFDEK